MAEALKQRINIREDRDQGVGGSHRIRLPFMLLLVGINIYSSLLK